MAVRRGARRRAAEAGRPLIAQLRPQPPDADNRAVGPQPDILVSERHAIASRDAGEGYVLDERLERNCHTRNIAFAVGGKREGKLTG